MIEHEPLADTEREIKDVLKSDRTELQKVQELMRIVINERADILRDVCIRPLEGEE